MKVLKIRKSATIYDMMIACEWDFGKVTRAEMHALKDGKKSAIKSRRKYFDVTIRGNLVRLAFSKNPNQLTTGQSI